MHLGQMQENIIWEILKLIFGWKRPNQTIKTIRSEEYNNLINNE